MKPQPPEYPRNVPDIDLEEDILLPGAVVYTPDEDDAGDAEELAKIRAAKRRSIEANAHAYLREEGLFILTAGLRGPFDNGWNNPWALRVKKRKQEAVAHDTAVSRAQKMLRKDHLGSQTPWKSGRARQPVPANPFERARSEHIDQPSPEQKVENWLRRNSALPYQSFTEPTSPTPKKQPVPTPRPQSSRRDWTPTKQVITVSSQDVKAPIHHPDQRVADSFETIVANGRGQADPSHAHSRLQNALEAGSPVTARKRPASSNQAADERAHGTNRAETAIIRMKRRKFDAGTTTAEPLTVKKLATEIITNMGGTAEMSTHKPQIKDVDSENHDQPPLKDPAMDVKPGLSAVVASEVKLKKLEASIDDQLHQGRPEKDYGLQVDAGEDQGRVRTMMPPPSTTASEVQSTNFLPSAQPRPELQTSISNVSSGALLAKVNETTTGSSAARSDIGVYEHVHAQAEHVSKSVDLDEEGTREPHVRLNDKMSSHSNVPQLEQQATDARPEPSPKKEKGADEAQNEKALRTSPSPAKKAKVGTKRKSASFAAEQSSLPVNGSIKSVLRVQKAGQTTKFSSGKASPPPFFPDRDIDMDTSIEQEDDLPHSLQQRHRPHSSTIKPAKGILKTSNTPSSATFVTPNSPTKTRDFAGSSRDLLISGQNGIAHEDEDFDLDGAINEMGSFLSTWDEEKGGLRVS